MPRLVVPIRWVLFADSRASSSSRCKGRISAAFSATSRLSGDTLTPSARTRSTSSANAHGSTTTPLPMTASLPGRTTPEGSSDSLYVTPSMTRVCPALWPPWNRTTTSARADSQSTIFPFPSSPHWAPITATLAMKWFARMWMPNPSASGVRRESAWYRSEGECAGLFHPRKRADFLEHAVGDALVHLNDADGVGSGRRAAQIEVRDVHPGIAQQRAEFSDKAWLVLVGDVEHVRREFGVQVDALDLD